MLPRHNIPVTSKGPFWTDYILEDRPLDHKLKFVTTVALIFFPLFSGGCASFRLYSETRDKQGTAAKEAWSKVDLGSTVATERDNLKKLLDLELETQDQL